MTDYLDTQYGRIAYNRLEGSGPGVVFLGGLNSDMQGTKAMFLADWAQRQGRAFLRFDYTGHGASSGEFSQGCIGDWSRDALAAIKALTNGPQLVIGSSMGGWIGLLLARAIPEKFAGFIGIAAAPDFTEDSMWAVFDETQRAALFEQGYVELPSDYAESGYHITRNFIEDGRNNLVLRTSLKLPFPARLLQGTADLDVDMNVALRLLAHAEGADIRLTLVKGADHRFSTPECLALLQTTIAEIENPDG